MSSYFPSFFSLIFCSPYFPGSFSAVPHFVELFVVAQHVHGFPEPSVFVGVHESVASHVFQRPSFQRCVVASHWQIVKYFWLAHKESDVYPVAVALRFLLEALYHTVVAIDVYGTKFSFRPEYGHTDCCPRSLMFA